MYGCKPDPTSKWLAPLLAHTLPLPSVFVVWDSILSRPTRIRSNNPKLEYLLDICVAMLCRARARLARFVFPHLYFTRPTGVD